MVIFVNYPALPYHKPTKLFRNRGKKFQNAPRPYISITKNKL